MAKTDERKRSVTCNFDRFEIHDRARPLAPPLVVRLRDLPKEVHRLKFLVDPKEKAVDRELEISVQAGRIVGELYDALLERYETFAGLVGPRVPRYRDAPEPAGERDARPYQATDNPDNPDNPVKNDSPRSPDLHGNTAPSVPLHFSTAKTRSPDFPDLHGKIAATAQSILSARSRYPDASLADLYDPLTMPPDLRAAHAANDRAVLAAYGLKPDTPEPEVVARLFRLYAEKVEK